MLKLEDKNFSTRNCQHKNQFANQLETPKIRLYLNYRFENNNILNHKLQIANNDFNYLISVMRQKVGDKIIFFNGIDGDFLATITDIHKKFLTIEINKKINNLKAVPNITLAFALIKNIKIDLIATKACELGVKNFQPIITQRTIIDKINLERFKANIKEACEQCGRNDMPTIFNPQKLKILLQNDFSNKIIILCDESGSGLQAKEILPKINYNSNQEIIIFTGPEGGFSAEEFQNFYNLQNCYALNLGPRILRADTAIISALTLVQEFLGDFNLKANFS